MVLVASVVLAVMADGLTVPAAWVGPAGPLMRWAGLVAQEVRVGLRG